MLAFSVWLYRVWLYWNCGFSTLRGGERSFLDLSNSKVSVTLRPSASSSLHWHYKKGWFGVFFLLLGAVRYIWNSWPMYSTRGLGYTLKNKNVSTKTELNWIPTIALLFISIATHYVWFTDSHSSISKKQHSSFGSFLFFPWQSSVSQTLSWPCF